MFDMIYKYLNNNYSVMCDICNQGYHQKCHKPRIGDEILEPDIPWTCRLCVFALGTKEGGAEKNGPIGKALKLMKRELPYDLNELNWDELHQRNSEGKYCYCGGNGNYFSKMLRCEQCLQWFHEACIQALETPLLYGDHYYTFKCSVCNKGKEYLKRIIMKWSDVMALVINNLALQHQKRFFDINTEILSFVQNNCHLLKLSEDITKLTEDELLERILAVLNANKSRFICGKEVRKRASLWALRLPFPFTTPLIFAPPFALQSSSSNATSPSSSPPFPNRMTSEPNSPNAMTVTTPLIYGACRKGATKWPSPKRLVNQLTNKIVQKNGRSNSCSSSTGSNSCNASTISYSSRCYSSQTTSSHISKKRTNCSKSAKRQKRVAKFPPSDLNSDSSDIEVVSTSPIESLEAVIPPLKNFEGNNNPFLDTDHRVLRNCLEITSKKRNSTESHNHLNNDLTINRISSKTESFNGDNDLDKTSPKMECYLNSNQRNDKFNILAQRIKPNGTVEYLLEWDNN
jgi:polycomb-like protein 2